MKFYQEVVFIRGFVYSLFFNTWRDGVGVGAEIGEGIVIGTEVETDTGGGGAAPGTETGTDTGTGGVAA